MNGIEALQMLSEGFHVRANCFAPGMSIFLDRPEGYAGPLIASRGPDGVVGPWGGGIMFFLGRFEWDVVEQVPVDEAHDMKATVLDLTPVKVDR